MIDVNMKTIAAITVKRSKFFSTTVEPAMAPPIEPPPKRSESPPPLPACKSTKISKPAEAIMWIAIRTEVNVNTKEIIAAQLPYVGDSDR